jgi:hypothetical protein
MKKMFIIIFIFFSFIISCDENSDTESNPQSSNFMGAKVSLSSPDLNTIPSDNVGVSVKFDTIEEDIGGFVSTDNSSKFIVPKGGAGYYIIHGVVFFEQNNINYRACWIQHNGIKTQSFLRVLAYSNTSTGVRANIVLKLNEGDVIEFYAGQNSGSSLKIQNSGYEKAYFSAYRIGTL